MLNHFRFSVYLFTADNNDDYEEVRPPDNKKFQGEMHEILEGIRDLETKFVSFASKLLVAVFVKNEFG